MYFNINDILFVGMTEKLGSLLRYFDDNTYSKLQEQTVLTQKHLCRET